MAEAEAGEQTVSAQQLDARRRWRDTIAARIAGFQTLIDDHQEQATQGLLPREELDWVAKEIRGWTRHLETLTARIEQLQEERV